MAASYTLDFSKAANVSLAFNLKKAGGVLTLW